MYEMLAFKRAMPIKMEPDLQPCLPLEVQIFINDTVDFLKSISPRTLPGVQELQRRDLLHRASDLAFEEQNITEDEEDFFEDEGTGCLEYALVRKSAQMIGSLYLLNRQCPTVKQRTTAVIHNARLMLYNNGKNPKVPRLIIDLTEAFAIIGGIEANCRFCIVDGSQTKHEFEALDEDERAEWVTELEKCRDFSDSGNGIEVEDLEMEDIGDYESSIYEEVGPILIYDVPKNSLNSSTAPRPSSASDPPASMSTSEAPPNSLTPPPPLPMRTLRIEHDSNTDADFPPPPAFEDTLMQHRHHGGPPLAPPAPPAQQHTCSSKILVDPNAKKNTASMITNNFHTALSEYQAPPPVPPPLPKPNLVNSFTLPKNQGSVKMIPPPPPPNSNKIQIFTKSPLKALKAAAAASGHKSHSSSTTSDKPPKSPHQSSKKRESFNFDEELKQKINSKKNSVDFDESIIFSSRHNLGGCRDRGQTSASTASIATATSSNEGELEAILKKRRERLFSSPELINLGRNSSFRPQNEAEKSTAASTASSVSTSSTTASLLRKTSSFRFGGGSLSEAGKFNTLPHRFNTTAASNKPRVPDKKPTVFVREHSLKLQQSWSRISAGNKCI